VVKERNKGKAVKESFMKAINGRNCKEK